MNIVLSSGFLVPQTIGPIDYFRDVKALIKAKGHRVVAPPVPIVASCRARAQALANGIEAKFHKEPIHLIAHSMGGLDCRMMIGENMNGFGEEGRVRSLTMLSTPHKGSPLADLLAGKGPEDLRRSIFDALEQEHIDIGAVRDLASDVDGKLADVPGKFPRIHCRSYAAAGSGGLRPTSFLLLPTYAYIKHKFDQDNDGAVAVTSATYGEFKETWPCDHFEMVGHNFDPPPLGGIGQSVTGSLGLARPRFDHLPKFDQIVDELQAFDKPPG